MKRAIRRGHVARLKKARMNYWWNVSTFWIEHHADSDYKSILTRKLGLVVKTPTPCSCWMCGNARKYFKELTRAELKHLDKFKEGLEEIHEINR